MSPEPEESRLLSESINTATRSLHTKLNRLLLARLQLALLLDDEGHLLYVTGLLHVAPIYSTFEALWRDVVETPSGSAPGNKKHVAHTCPRTRKLLSDLLGTGLVRSQALRADLRAMTNWSEAELEQNLADAADCTVLGRFLAQITRSVEAKPHVLVAYGWVLYMALFSGGKYIRGVLEKHSLSGPSSSSSPSTEPTQPSKSDEADDVALPSSPPEPSSAPIPTSFFHFDTPTDGEDLKLAFKRRVAEAEAELTPKEREDVIAEAQTIFTFMIELVGELDEVCGTDPEALSGRPGRAQEVSGGGGDGNAPARRPRPAGGLLAEAPALKPRDSMCVTRERRAKKGGSAAAADKQQQPLEAEKAVLATGGAGSGGGHVRFR